MDNFIEEVKLNLDLIEKKKLQGTLLSKEDIEILLLTSLLQEEED